MKDEYDFSNARPNPYVDKLRHVDVDVDSGEEPISPGEDFAKFVDESTLPIMWPENEPDDYEAAFREEKRLEHE